MFYAVNLQLSYYLLFSKWFDFFCQHARYSLWIKLDFNDDRLVIWYLIRFMIHSLQWLNVTDIVPPLICIAITGAHNMVPLTSGDSVTELNLTYVLVYQYWGTVCSEICIDFNRAHQISEATYCQWNQSYCMSCNWKQWIINIVQMRWIKLKHGSTLGHEHSQLTLNPIRAKFFRVNINMNLHLISFFHTST